MLPSERVIGKLLDFGEAKEILHRWAQRNLNVGELYIFGSYAEGTARPDSDLDVAIRILHKQPGDTTLWVTWKSDQPVWAEQLSEILGMKVDLQESTNPYIRGSLQKAIQIYIDAERLETAESIIWPTIGMQS